MPPGVPVRITSPGNNVMFVEMKLTSSAGLKMSCFVFEFWRNWPFWKSWMVYSFGSIFVSTYGPSGVNVSNDLHRAHWLSEFWMVRSLMSCAVV